MGGAARNEKRRQQEDAARRLAAAGITVPPRKNTTPLRVVGVVVLVAVLAGGGYLWFRTRVVPVPAPTYTVAATDAVVTAGTGRPSIDVYEDYLCPNCERFEQRDQAAITKALNAGRLTVRYHMIAILDRDSSPAGYSTRAADAALCAVPAGIFPAYHVKLFDQQPAEGSAGLSDTQLVALGAQLGARGDFAGCVTQAAHAAAVAAETKKVVTDAALQTAGQFGTPTVAVGGKKIDLNDSGWLSAVTG